MQKISLTGLGIEGAIKDINRYFDSKIAAVPMPEKKQDLGEKETDVNAVHALETEGARLPLPQSWIRPCQTCGKETGFQDDRNPHVYIWCINQSCEDNHTVFTIEEWQQDRAHSADL